MTNDPLGQIGNKPVFKTQAFHEANDIVQAVLGMTGGRQVLISRKRDQVIIGLNRRGRWLHPWFTSAQWKDEKQEFWITVNPGFVNGVAPNVPSLTFEYYQTDQEDSKKKVIPTLLDDWAFPVSRTREIRGVELDQERVPQYFQDMGVVEEKTGIKATDTGVKVNKSQEQTSGEDARLLRAADVVLTAYRPTYKLDVDYPMNLITGQLVDYSAAWDITNAFKPVQITVMHKIPAPKKENDAFDRIMGNYGDEGFDQLLVATIYFISPKKKSAKKPLTSVTDEWTPIVQHQVFWNLAYWSDNQPPTNFKQLDISPAMVLVGRYTFAPAAAFGALQSLADNIFEAVFNKPPKGYFYTI